MQQRYTVHSMSEEPITTSAVLPGGQVVEAQVLGLVVELIPQGGGATLTLRYVPTDMIGDKALFTVGNGVTTRFELTL